MSKGLRYLFLVHAIVAVVIGAPLLIAPGRLLGLFGWAPVDPLISRILGAALLALAWGSLRGWRASGLAQVGILIELEAVFTALGCIGLLRHLLFANWPPIVWAVFAVLAIFAVAWIVTWFSVRGSLGGAART